jgi:threonine aldolase
MSVVDERNWRQVHRDCVRWLSSQHPSTAAGILRAAADALPEDEPSDDYGVGDFLEAFEQRVAGLLGKPAAIVLPSGTMAQQIALRIHCDARATHTVAFHPTSHLELHERGSYAHLHGLKAELVGERDRLIELSDLESMNSPLGALLLELPQREIGGRLPEWSDLVAQIQWARDRGVATHLDGARIWEAAPYYERSPAEIATLFDSVYVSLYKGLGGFGGCVLAGVQDLIDQARVWRRRHGGELPALFPFAASAIPGLDRLIPKMPDFLEHARALGAALAQVPGVVVVPSTPQTPLFHLHLDGEREDLEARALDLARERQVWLFRRLRASVVPGVQVLELNIGEPALAISPAEAAELFHALLAQRSQSDRT